VAHIGQELAPAALGKLGAVQRHGEFAGAFGHPRFQRFIELLQLLA